MTSGERSWPTGKRDAYLTCCAKSCPPIASTRASFRTPVSMWRRSLGADATPLAELARLPFTTKAELLDDQARHPPYGEILTYPLERLQPAASDLRHVGTAAALARHAGKLVAVARLLGDDVPHGRRRAGGSAVLSVLVRPVPRLLDGVRGGVAARLPVPARRRNEQRRPPALPARQRGHRRSLHADLRPASGGGRAERGHRPCRLLGAQGDRGRRAGRQHPGDARTASRAPGARGCSITAA